MCAILQKYWLKTGVQENIEFEWHTIFKTPIHSALQQHSWDIF
jgi:hypothetical protein